MPSLFDRPMSPTPFGALASLKLRSLSALVLTGYVVFAAGLHALGGAAERFGIPGEVMRALAGFGLVGAVVHALWFGLLLTRRGRAIACALAGVCAILLLIALGSRAFAGAGPPAGVMALRNCRTEMFTWLDKRAHRSALELSGLRRRLAGANRSTSANRRAHYDWLHRKRGHGPHPLFQQVKTTAAGVLFFSVPVLFPLLAILFAFNRAVGRLFG